MAKKLTATHGEYTIAIDETGAVKVTLSGEECKNTKSALCDIAKDTDFVVEDKWNTRQFGKKLAEYLQINCALNPQQCVESDNFEEVDLIISGVEADYVCNRPVDDAFSCLSEVYGFGIDDPEDYDPDEDCHCRNLGRKVVELKDCSGIMRYEGSAEYVYSLKIDDEFDPDLLTLNFADLVIKVGSEEIEAEEHILWNITYDGVDYEMYDGDSDFVSGDLIWGNSEDEDDENDSSDVLDALKKKYDKVFDDGDIYTVCLEGKWGFADKKANVLIAPKYDWLGDSFVDGMIVAGYHDNGKMGYVNNKGIEVIAPKYDSVMDFSQGYASVKLDDKWGVVDKEGNEVIPLVYDYVECFDKGKVKVKLNDEEFYIDINNSHIK